MSKKGNKKTANKSLETLKRKQYARGGRRGNPPARKAAQPVQELKQIKSAPIPLKVSDQKPTKIGGKPTPLPKPIGNKGIDPKSLFSDPVKVGGIKNPKDIKLPEPSRSTGGGRGRPIGNQPTVPNIEQQLGSGGRETLLGNQTPISNESIAPPRPPQPLGESGQLQQLQRAALQESETIKNAQYTPKGTSNLPNLKDSLGSQELFNQEKKSTGDTANFRRASHRNLKMWRNRLLCLNPNSLKQHSKA